MGQVWAEMGQVWAEMGQVWAETEYGNTAAQVGTEHRAM